MGNPRDRVQVVSNERLDKPDFDSGHARALDVGEAGLGGIVGASAGGALVTSGPGGGALSWFTFGTSNLAAVTVGEGMLYYCDRAGAGLKLAQGTVYRHDTTLAWQGTQTFSLSSYQAGAGTPWIWFKPTEVDAEVDTRRKWDTGTSAEVAFAANTSKRVRIVFTAGTTSPGTGYVKFARVRSWSGSVPTIESLSPWDTEDTGLGGGGETLRTLHAVLNAEGRGTMGVPDVLTKYLAILKNILDTAHAADTTFNWQNSPAKGLKQLKADVDPLNTLATELKTQRILVSGYLSWSGAVYSTDFIRSVGDGAVAKIVNGVGDITLTFANVTGWDLTKGSVQATPQSAIRGRNVVTELNTVGDPWVRLRISDHAGLAVDDSVFLSIIGKKL